VGIANDRMQRHRAGILTIYREFRSPETSLQGDANS